MKNLINKKLVFDNAVLSNFARINKLELLFYLSKELITTKEVIEEVKKGIRKKPTLFSIIELVNKNKISVGTLEQTESIIFMDGLIQGRVLGIGEISAMVLAREVNGLFITDDEQASKKAASIGIEIFNKHEFRDTVNFLEILLKNKQITKNDYGEIVGLLAKESFKI
ncbi:hypothetical protein KAJ89_01335 [Candidatus Parcubacteria bacterium]|nr:hypothetical protein [Candidatus Parcubacteria bacterium]